MPQGHITMSSLLPYMEKSSWPATYERIRQLPSVVQQTGDAGGWACLTSAVTSDPNLSDLYCVYMSLVGAQPIGTHSPARLACVFRDTSN